MRKTFDHFTRVSARFQLQKAGFLPELRSGRQSANSCLPLTDPFDSQVL
jgi:hypothetical protein